MSARDSVKKRNDGRGPAPTCGFGCQTFRPLSCEVLDPYTVLMRAACVRCGKEQQSVGDLRGLIDEERGAEDFARDFMNGPLGGARS